MIRQTKTIENMRALVGQPINYPEELISILITYFSSNKNIERGYLACVQYPDSMEQIKLLIGVDTSSDLTKIVFELENNLNSLSS